jgi:hypothetical protein
MVKTKSRREFIGQKNRYFTLFADDTGQGAPCSFGLSATSQQYFSLRTNQASATSQQYFLSEQTSTSHQPLAKRKDCKWSSLVQWSECL